MRKREKNDKNSRDPTGDLRPPGPDRCMAALGAGNGRPPPPRLPVALGTRRRGG
jgi:hypothetical protein